APLGPMMPSSTPESRDSVTRSAARTAPNDFSIPSSVRSGAGVNSLDPPAKSPPTAVPLQLRSFSFPPVGIDAAVRVSTTTSSHLYVLPRTHWPPTSGVRVTFLTGPLPPATGATVRARVDGAWRAG